ncbi:TadE family protein [Anaerocolumna sp.]|uniref:TadE family protein n=1 Tax=Anaerocolumna sp. TaxID=2041569 RepID=UPI0028AB90B6|nr:pilus assembly protein [Anaerocolumna sp.]
MDKSTVKGSYTVEAALILPMILFIIAGLLYLGFYLHDKVKIQSVINDISTKGRELIQYEADLKTGLIDYDHYQSRFFLYPYFSDFVEKENNINTYLAEELNRGLFIAKVDSVAVSVTFNRIRISVNGHMDIPFIEVKQLFTNSGLTFSDNNTMEIHNTEEFIRVLDVFSGVADKVKFIDDILQNLQKLIGSIK